MTFATPITTSPGPASLLSPISAAPQADAPESAPAFQGFLSGCLGQAAPAPQPSAPSIAHKPPTPNAEHEQEMETGRDPREDGAPPEDSRHTGAHEESVVAAARAVPFLPTPVVSGPMPHAAPPPAFGAGAEAPRLHDEPPTTIRHAMASMPRDVPPPAADDPMPFMPPDGSPSIPDGPTPPARYDVLSVAPPAPRMATVTGAPSPTPFVPQAGLPTSLSAAPSVEPKLEAAPAKAEGAPAPMAHGLHFSTPSEPSASPAPPTVAVSPAPAPAPNAAAPIKEAPSSPAASRIASAAPPSAARPSAAPQSVARPSAARPSVAVSWATSQLEIAPFEAPQSEGGPVAHSPAPRAEAPPEAMSQGDSGISTTQTEASRPVPPVPADAASVPVNAERQPLSTHPTDTPAQTHPRPHADPGPSPRFGRAAPTDAPPAPASPAPKVSHTTDVDPPAQPTSAPPPEADGPVAAQEPEPPASGFPPRAPAQPERQNGAAALAPEQTHVTAERAPVANPARPVAAAPRQESPGVSTPRFVSLTQDGVTAPEPETGRRVDAPPIEAAEPRPVTGNPQPTMAPNRTVDMESPAPPTARQPARPPESDTARPTPQTSVAPEASIAPQTHASRPAPEPLTEPEGTANRPITPPVGPSLRSIPQAARMSESAPAGETDATAAGPDAPDAAAAGATAAPAPPAPPHHAAPPPAAVAPLPPAMADRVIEQVARVVRVQVDEDRGEMLVRLDPPELGRLQIRLLTQDGAITAALHAESEATRQALEANLPALRAALDQAGLAVQKVSIISAPDAATFASMASSGQFLPSDPGGQSPSGHASSRPRASATARNAAVAEGTDMRQRQSAGAAAGSLDYFA